MKYILVGRHTSEALGVEVAEQRNIMWATELAECVSQWQALQADAAQAGMGVLLQNVPGILAVAIARAGFKVHTGVIISVPGARLASVEARFDLGCGRWAETAAAAVKHANGRAQTAVDGWTLSVTVDPVSPFVFKGIEWFNDAPTSTPTPEPTKGAIVDASEAQALADLGVRSVSADDAPVAYYDLPPYMGEYPVPQPRFGSDPSSLVVREEYGVGEILRVSDTFAFARYEGLSADVYLRRPKGLALVVGQRIITEAPQRGAKGWSAEWVQDYKGRPNLSLTPEWVSKLPTLAERDAAEAEYQAAKSAYEAWLPAKQAWRVEQEARLREIHGAALRIGLAGQLSWNASQLDAERWLTQRANELRWAQEDAARQARIAHWDAVIARFTHQVQVWKASHAAHVRWETPERVASWGVSVEGVGIREGKALYCTDEGVVLVELPAMQGAEACVTHAKWSEVASVLYRADGGWSHGDPYGMFGEHDEDWNVPASAWVTLWTPPVGDAEASAGNDDEDAPSLSDYASKLRGAA